MTARHLVGALIGMALALAVAAELVDRCVADQTKQSLWGLLLGGVGVAAGIAVAELLPWRRS